MAATELRRQRHRDDGGDVRAGEIVDVVVLGDDEALPFTLRPAVDLAVDLQDHRPLVERQARVRVREVDDGRRKGEPPVGKLGGGARYVRPLLHRKRILEGRQDDTRPRAREVAVDGDGDVERVRVVMQAGELHQLVAEMMQAVLGLAARPYPGDSRQVVRADRRHRVARPLRRRRALKPHEPVGKRPDLVEALAHYRLDQAEVLADDEGTRATALVGQQ